MKDADNTMAFVIDASVALCWGLRDEDHPVASFALTLAESESIFAPAIWWFEVRNILIQNERRKRIDVLAQKKRECYANSGNSR